LLPKDLRFEHGGAKFVSCLRRHLTSSRPCTSHLSSQHVEICLQKYLPISCRLSITNYLKQNSVDYRSNLTTENNLKVEKKVYYFENKHNFPLTSQKRSGTRRNKHAKKLESNNYAGTLPFELEGIYCITRALKTIRQYFPRHSGRYEVCRESMTKFSSIQFFVRNATIRNIVQ